MNDSALHYSYVYKLKAPEYFYSGAFSLYTYEMVLLEKLSPRIQPSADGHFLTCKKSNTFTALHMQIAKK
jgi:hypothetical protein